MYEMNPPVLEKQPKIDVLVALLGNSPAVITETVWALAVEEEFIPDEIIVFTTTSGAKTLEPFWGSAGIWKKFLSDLKAHLGSLKKGSLNSEILFGKTSVKIIPDQNWQPAEDIHSPEDNVAMADFFMKEIGNLALRDFGRIFVSIAGGRKTMGALLHSVMTLVGRPQDKIFHILVNEPWEKVRSFTHPGCTLSDEDKGKFHLDTKTAKLFLADVPFFPLIRLFREKDRKELMKCSYRVLMDRCRQELGNGTPDFRLKIGFKERKAYCQLGDGSWDELPKLSAPQYSYLIGCAVAVTAPVKCSVLQKSRNRSMPQDYDYPSHVLLKEFLKQEGPPPWYEVNEVKDENYLKYSSDATSLLNQIKKAKKWEDSFLKLGVGFERVFSCGKKNKRVLVIRRGQLICEGFPDELMDEPL